MKCIVVRENRKGTAKNLQHITTKSEAQNSYKIYNSITKWSEIALLSTLHIGHCSLNHRFHHEDSLECSCGSSAIETVEHFLIYCPKYHKERSKLIKNIGVGGIWLKKLLGYSKFIKFTLEYVKETGRFVF